MNQMKIGTGAVLKIMKLEILQSAPYDPKPNHRWLCTLS